MKCGKLLAMDVNISEVLTRSFMKCREILVINVNISEVLTRFRNRYEVWEIVSYQREH